MAPSLAHLAGHASIPDDFSLIIILHWLYLCVLASKVKITDRTWNKTAVRPAECVPLMCCQNNQFAPTLS